MAFCKNPAPLVEVRNWRVLARPVRFFFFLFFYFLSLRPWYSMQVIWQQGAFTFPAARAQPQQCPTSTCSPPPTLCPFPGFSPSSFPEQDHNLLLPLRDLSSEGYIILNGFAKKEPFWKAALQPIQKQLIDHQKQSCCQQHFLCCRCCVVNNHFLPPDSLFSKVKFNFGFCGEREREQSIFPRVVLVLVQQLMRAPKVTFCAEVTLVLAPPCKSLLLGIEQKRRRAEQFLVEQQGKAI